MRCVLEERHEHQQDDDGSNQFNVLAAHYSCSVMPSASSQIDMGLQFLASGMYTPIKHARAQRLWRSTIP
jgi:hypothetical protein